MPESDEEAQAVMSQWRNWFSQMGDQVVDSGNPVGKSSTVHTDGSVTDDGGSNPLSGYSIVEANTLEDALALAKDCPVLAAEGSVEVAMIMEMD